MDYNPTNIVIIGSGTMASQVASVLSVPQDTDTYIIGRSMTKAKAAVEGAVEDARLSSLRSRIHPGTYGRHLRERLERAELIVETLSEDPELKREYFALVDKYRNPDSIVATSSSGLYVTGLAEGMSDSFREHFLCIHPYQPARKLIAVENVPGRDTSEETLDRADNLMSGNRYRRKLVRANDTPAYAGNRIGFMVLNFAAQSAEGDLGVEQTDYLFGGHTGRTMTPLATIDLVGLDVHRDIVNNIYDKTNDEAHALFALPEVMKMMIQRGMLGTKTGRGFYMYDKDGRPTHALNLETMRYKELRGPETKGRIQEAKELIHKGLEPEAVRLLLSPNEEYGHYDYVRSGMLGYISYAGMRDGEVADIDGINRVMGYGFNWAPPYALVDLAGAQFVSDQLTDAGLSVPVHIQEAAKDGRKLYTEPGDQSRRYLSAA